MASSVDSDKAINTGRTHASAPAEGERRALRGYMGQYEKVGAAIYTERERRLIWCDYPFGRCVTFYAPVDGGIDVVRVLHSARDVDAAFGDES